ncbi:MAG: bifunctional folylpolyglutamate synthase/dihydrofolate synthase [Chitinophagaceae bacterium]|nr:bifunctional folylpolyglutamate synthase/dihydrofolate synthase [Chitinophagaceae bacterium]
MTYQETLAYMFRQLPFFSRIGAAAYKADLGNITLLCEQLNHPEKKFKSIHIAGTNGKGSTSHMLASVLQESNYKVGLYTSPHIKDFRERIKINGKEVSEQYVIDFIATHKVFIEEIKPSFFEITVAMAFDFFAKENVDIAIIEVGMGGRLDSTNIILPELSIVTNIGLDHTEFLGDTLEKIAREKAGIIKNKIPVIISETKDETKNVFFSVSISKDSPIYFADDYIEVLGDENEHLKLIDKTTMSILNIKLPLNGNYQRKNLKAVAMAVDLLRKNNWKISANNFVDGIENTIINTALKGRFELIQLHPTIIYDVSHNVEGVENTLAQLKKMTFNKLYFVLGFVKDKNVDAVISLFPDEAIFICAQSTSQRAMESKLLYEKFKKFKDKVFHYETIEAGLNFAKQEAHKDDTIIVIGSFFNLENLY